MSTINEVKAKKYAADMKAIRGKCPRLADAVTALHEGVKVEEKYAMMDKLVNHLDIEHASKVQLEQNAERIEKRVEERKAAEAKARAEGPLMLDPLNHDHYVSKDEYTEMAKMLRDDPHCK